MNPCYFTSLVNSNPPSLHTSFAGLARHYRYRGKVLAIDGSYHALRNLHSLRITNYKLSFRKLWSRFLATPCDNICKYIRNSYQLQKPRVFPSIVIHYRHAGLVVVVRFILLRTNASIYVRRRGQYTKRILIKKRRRKRNRSVV